MGSPFIYGMSVDGEHFTDREWETKRLALNFTRCQLNLDFTPTHG